MSDSTNKLQELTHHRGIVSIGEEQIIRMLNLGSPEYVVLGVSGNFYMNAVEIVVAHPSLPYVPDGYQAPNAGEPRWGREVRVIDGEVWERSKLTLDSPEVLASRMYDMERNKGIL